MRIMILIKNKLAMRFIASFTAVLCSFLLVRTVCSGIMTADEDTVRVLAYTGIGSQSGQITAKELEKDIRYLTNKGYSPVFVSELADSLHGECTLPLKSVLLTFDGGCASYYTELFPLLKKYRFKATVTVYGEQTEYASNSADDNSAFLRWNEIKEMDSSGLIEFSNGTYSMIQGVQFRQSKDEDYEQFRTRIVNDIDRLQSIFQQNCGFEPCIFTYPGGIAEDNAARLVKNLGFKAALSLGDKPVHTDGKKKTDTYRISRYARSDIRNIDDMFE